MRHGPYREIGPGTISIFLGLLMLTSVVLVPGSGAVSGDASHAGAAFQANPGPSAFPKAIAVGSLSLAASVDASDYLGVIATVPVNSGPSSAVYDSGNGYVYVPNGPFLGVISGTSVVANIFMGSSVGLPACDSGNGYVYVSTVAGMAVVSGTSVVATIPFGGGGFPVYDSSNGYVYVPGPSLSVISGTNVVASVNIGNNPGYAAYDSGNGYVYVPNTGSNNVSVISGTTVVASVNVGNNPEYAAYDSGNGYVYVTNAISGSVSVIGGTNAIATVSVGSDPYSATYDSGNGYVYVANAGSGSVSVISGTNVVGTVSVGETVGLRGNPPRASATYDSGDGYVYVPNDASNNVSVIGGTKVVATIPVGISPGLAAYDSGDGYVYVPNGLSDTVSVIGLIYTYPVTFAESGLPPGASWSVTLNAATNASTNSTITFARANGTYHYAVATVPGYTTSRSSGVVTVNGTGVTRAIPFSPIPPGEYAVTFTETGLPLGTLWSVTLNGTAASSPSSGITFVELNGTYAYRFDLVPRWTMSSYSGSITVRGGTVGVPVTWTEVTYPVTFTESGLPSGVLWSATLNGTTDNSTSSYITFTEPNGTYPYTSSTSSGWTPPPDSHDSGSVTVNGGTVGVPVAWMIQPGDYILTFTETGLPPGTSWSVAISGETYGGSLNAPISSIIFTLSNGTYGFTVGSISGYTSSPLSGTCDGERGESLPGVDQLCSGLELHFWGEFQLAIGGLRGYRGRNSGSSRRGGDWRDPTPATSCGRHATSSVDAALVARQLNGRLDWTPRKRPLVVGQGILPSRALLCAATQTLRTGAQPAETV